MTFDKCWDKCCGTKPQVVIWNWYCRETVLAAWTLTYKSSMAQVFTNLISKNARHYEMKHISEHFWLIYRFRYISFFFFPYSSYKETKKDVYFRVLEFSFLFKRLGIKTFFFLPTFSFFVESLQDRIWKCQWQNKTIQPEAFWQNKYIFVLCLIQIHKRVLLDSSH